MLPVNTMQLSSQVALGEVRDTDIELLLRPKDSAGVVIQMFAASALATIVVGRLVAGFGVGFVSAIMSVSQLDLPGSETKTRPLTRCFALSILYMSEICPKKVRGALVSGYRTLGYRRCSVLAY